MQFCPTCANVLLVGKGANDMYRFFCNTCPYIHSINRKIARKVQLKRKKVDDVLGGAEAWKNAQKGPAICPKCNSKEAYFQQVQTRSADEPATTFFRCCNTECEHNWKEN